MIVQLSLYREQNNVFSFHAKIKLRQVHVLRSKKTFRNPEIFSIEKKKRGLQQMMKSSNKYGSFFEITLRVVFELHLLS